MDNDVFTLGRDSLIKQIHNEIEKRGRKAVDAAMQAARNPENEDLLADAALATLEFDIAERLERHFVNLIYASWPKHEDGNDRS